MHREIDLERWETPASAYPRKRLGRARIEGHSWGRGGRFDAYGQHPPGEEEGYDYIHAVERLRMTNLQVRGSVVMIDEPTHWWSIQRSAAIYRGHVLVAGLGLGLIVHALAANPAVTAITVVERDRDVIGLVGPLVPRCRIVRADWFGYRPDFVADGVFFDLFVGEGAELFGEALGVMARLTTQYPGVPVRILGFPFSESTLQEATWGRKTGP